MYCAGRPNIIPSLLTSLYSSVHRQCSSVSCAHHAYDSGAESLVLNTLPGTGDYGVHSRPIAMNNTTVCNCALITLYMYMYKTLIIINKMKKFQNK